MNLPTVSAALAIKRRAEWTPMKRYLAEKLQKRQLKNAEAEEIGKAKKRTPRPVEPVHTPDQLEFAKLDLATPQSGLFRCNHEGPDEEVNVTGAAATEQDLEEVLLRRGDKAYYEISTPYKLRDRDLRILVVLCAMAQELPVAHYRRTDEAGQHILPPSAAPAWARVECSAKDIIAELGQTDGGLNYPSVTNSLRRLAKIDMIIIKDGLRKEWPLMVLTESLNSWDYAVDLLPEIAQHALVKGGARDSEGNRVPFARLSLVEMRELRSDKYAVLLAWHFSAQIRFRKSMEFDLDDLTVIMTGKPRSEEKEKNGEKINDDTGHRKRVERIKEALGLIDERTTWNIYIGAKSYKKTILVSRPDEGDVIKWEKGKTGTKLREAGAGSPRWHRRMIEKTGLAVVTG
jgi:hypothetical protein